MAALTPPHISGHSPQFSTLPAEIRAMTYQYLFNETRLLTETIFNSRKRVDPSRISKITSILRVNRQCYVEALPLFYERATFTMRNVVGWRAASFNPSLSPWAGPTTARIRDLVITRSTPSCGVASLGDLFPSLRTVTIEIFSRLPRTLSLAPLPKAKINLATTVLMLYDHMCKGKLYTMKAQPFHSMLFKITEDQANWWILVAFWHRIHNGKGKDQYKMRLKVDLTDAIPWVKTYHAGTGASRFACGRIVGFYYPDEQMWTFTVNGRRVLVPELLKYSYWDGIEETK